MKERGTLYLGTCHIFGFETTTFEIKFNSQVDHLKIFRHT